jgi:magnesium chelatase subunit I
MRELSGKARILPYSLLVGQEQLKHALECAFIAPKIGGVLISGHRGTAKSTAVRAFSWMLRHELPVTLPINATDDRVVGGWRINELMQGRPEWQPGLLEQASDSGVLYVDEVNLLDDHIVNLILDASSTGYLAAQHEGQDRQITVSFTLVGTMNPEEGGLRPQLLDRFGLMVDVRAEVDQERRRQILQVVLAVDEAQAQGSSGHAVEFLRHAEQQNERRANELRVARNRLYEVEIPQTIAALCARLAARFQAAGHRGDYVMALAARASAALEGAPRVTVDHVQTVAPMALQHRRPATLDGGQTEWTKADEAVVIEVLAESRGG